MTVRELLDELRVEYLETGHHHCRPGWLQIKVCPFCGSEKYHLGFCIAANYFNCWKCSHHSVYSVFLELGASKKAIFEALKDTDRTVELDQRVRKGLKEPKGRGELLTAHIAYLRSRDLDPEEISRTWQIEGIGLAARLGWRIYIPIIHKGARVSWTTRAIGDKIPLRYISASAEEEAVNHKKVVYGADYCGHTCVIVEGPVDAWKIGPGAGALFGTTYSPAQVRRLARFPYRYVCFDSSKEAQAQAGQLAGELSCFPGVTCNIVLDAKDPGEASKREIAQLRRATKL